MHEGDKTTFVVVGFDDSEETGGAIQSKKTNKMSLISKARSVLVHLDLLQFLHQSVTSGQWSVVCMCLFLYSEDLCLLFIRMIVKIDQSHHSNRTNNNSSLNIFGILKTW